MKVFLGVLVSIGVIGTGIWLFSNQVSAPDTATYTDEVSVYTSTDSQFTVQYDETGDYAKLSLSGVQYTLERVVTASGAKYVSTDGSVTFSEEQETAMLQIGEVIIFQEATLEGSEAERRRVEVLKSNKQGDPSANKYDFGVSGASDGSAAVPCDAVDQDCTGGDDVSATDTTCGTGTVLEAGACVPEKLDDDNDGDSVSTEAEASDSAEASASAGDGSTDATAATDYNSSRSNKSY